MGSGRGGGLEVGVLEEDRLEVDGGQLVRRVLAGGGRCGSGGQHRRGRPGAERLAAGDAGRRARLVEGVAVAADAPQDAGEAGHLNLGPAGRALGHGRVERRPAVEALEQREPSRDVSTPGRPRCSTPGSLATAFAPCRDAAGGLRLEGSIAAAQRHPRQGRRLPPRRGPGPHQEGLRLLGQGPPGTDPQVGRALPGPPARGGGHPRRAPARRGLDRHRPPPRHHRGHPRHPRGDRRALRRGDRRPGGRGHQALPVLGREHQGGEAGRELPQDGRGHGQGHPGPARQAGRPHPQHADARAHGARRSRSASPRRRSTSTRRSPTGWACSRSRASSRTSPSST